MDAIFHPKSIAVVGVPRGMKSGKIFLMGLLDQGFPGRIFPVHPEAKEIDGLEAYSSVSLIPGTVDLAIVLVPHHQALSIIKECATKGVKAAVLFTSGYKETGIPFFETAERAMSTYDRVRRYQIWRGERAF